MPTLFSSVLRRRTWLLASTAAAATLAVPGIARAQAFPSRPITLIVPWPAGGPTDRHLRVLAEIAATHLGQPIVISNNPGAGGTLGPSTMAATARPDGYTMAQFPLGMLRHPHMHRVGWHPIDDFSFIIGVTGYTFGFVVRADAPFKTFNDFIEAARKQPGAVNYGSTGTGTSPHLLVAELAGVANVQLNHIPFAGSAPLQTALLGGHIMAMSDAAGGFARFIDAGQMRLLVTFGDARTERWPQVPTARELGHNVVSASPYGLVGPKGMDPAIVKILHDAFKKAMDDPKHLAVLKDLNQDLWYRDSAAYRQWAIDTFAGEKALIERLGLAAR